MRIESADVVVTSPGRNFVTLKLATSDGVVGLGAATVNGREFAVASYLRDHVAALLVVSFRVTKFRPGLVTMTSTFSIFIERPGRRWPIGHGCVQRLSFRLLFETD